MFRHSPSRTMLLIVLVVGAVALTVFAVRPGSPDPGAERSHASDDPTPHGRQLVWSDEFDGSEGAAPNPEHWTHETGGGGWGNDELQYYTDSTENSSLDGVGHLLITARAVDPASSGLDCWYGPCAYTSARLVTEHKQVFQYGRIEARVKVPAGGGLWPAVWMLGANIREVGWPQSGEIDVMEFVGRSPHEVFGTIHGPGYSGGESISGVRDLGVPVADEWHDFAVEWSPGRIAWEVDGVTYHEATPPDVAPDEWVFEHTFFLLTNVAVGGNFGGSVSEDVQFPQDLAIDFVRVYEREEAGGASS